MDDFKFAGSPASIALAAAIALAWATLPTGRLVAADPGAEAGLSAEVEAAFEAFAKEAAESRLGKVTATVERYGTELAENLALDAEAKAKLAERYPQIVEATQADWREKFRETLRPSLVRNPNPLEILEGWDPDAFARNSYYAPTRPDRTEAWQAALADVLSPEQLAAHTAAQLAEEEKLRAELADYFLHCEEMAAMQLEPIMEKEIEQITQLLSLDGPRVERLESAGKSALAGVVGDWRKRWEDQVSAMDDEQRKQRIANASSIQIDAASQDNPLKHGAWLDALGNHLTDAERAEVEKRRADVRQARSEALAMVLLGAIEPLVGLTAEQRGGMTVLLAKPLLALPDHYYVAQAENSYYSIDVWELFNAISGIVDSEILPLLDEGQAARWKAITAQNLSPNRSVGRTALEFDLPPAENLGPVEARRLIARYIHSHAKGYTRNFQAQMEASVDGILRLGELDGDKVAVLRTAAKGAAKALASNPINNFENWARGSLQNVAPVDLPARLKLINTPRFASREPSEVPPVWTSALERILTPEHKQAWEAECAAVKRWNSETKVSILLSEIDRQVLLTAEKRAALREILTPLLIEYERDLDGMFSMGWHLQGYYSTLPLALFTDEALAPVLGKEEITLLRSRIPGGYEGMLENLKNNRKARLKAERNSARK